MSTTIQVDTHKYAASHGHTPRQPRDFQTSGWAFQIDRNPAPVFIHASYKDAVMQAKALAHYSITVLP
jgi:hypothetical protein